MKATAKAHSNIALVKYWGKRNTELNLPAVGSISMTLEALYTETSVVWENSLARDVLVINSQSADDADTRRVSCFLDLIRERSKLSCYARVSSLNNFPTGAGLASSASGFAALALAASAAAGLSLSGSELSELARRGSGSAARSIFGGFVEMKYGEKADGSDSIGVQLYDEKYWRLVMIVAVTDKFKKPVGSTEGMLRTAETSPFYQSWVDSAETDLESMRTALEQRDFHRLGEIAEFSCLKMHGLMLSAKPAVQYWNPATIATMNKVCEMRESGIPAYFTIDGGPQVKVITLPGNAAKISRELQKVNGVKSILQSTIGPGAGLVE